MLVLITKTQISISTIFFIYICYNWLNLAIERVKKGKKPWNWILQLWKCTRFPFKNTKYVKRKLKKIKV